MLEGDTAEDVEGLVCNTRKTTYMFDTKKEMNSYLFRRVKKEKEEEERDKGIHVHKFSDFYYHTTNGLKLEYLGNVTN